MTLRGAFLLSGVLLAAAGALASAALGDETTETVAIRKVLDSEAIGWERADLKLLLDLYGPRFVGYVGSTTADRVRWRVSFADLDAFAELAEGRLQSPGGGLGAAKYTLFRRDTYFNVLGDQAVVVTQDSVRVTNRQTGEVSVFSGPVFWTFAKTGEDWLITGFVGRGFPSRQEPEAAPAQAEASAALAEVLTAEAEAWNTGDVGAILSHYSGDLVGYSGMAKADPGAWQVYFQDAEQFRTFLRSRLSRTSYRLVRSVIYSHVQGREAVVLTTERLSTTHRETGLTRSTERHTLWTLRRSGGRWQITRFFLDVGLPESG